MKNTAVRMEDTTVRMEDTTVRTENTTVRKKNTVVRKMDLVVRTEDSVVRKKNTIVFFLSAPAREMSTGRFSRTRLCQIRDAGFYRPRARRLRTPATKPAITTMPAPEGSGTISGAKRNPPPPPLMSSIRSSMIARIYAFCSSVRWSLPSVSSIISSYRPS
jgi:hypothetical protein